MTHPTVLRAALGLSLASTRHAWARSLIVSACLSLGLALPFAGRAAVARFTAALTERASTVPLVIGAPGSRYDLVFGSLYFRTVEIDPVPFGEYERVSRDRSVSAIPLHVRATARGRPVVATGIEYLQRRGLRVRQGRLFAGIGEVVLGSRAAASIGLAVGDAVSTDQRLAYDITETPSAMLTIVGVLEATGTPDDHAVFTDIETAWVIEGIAHAHDAAESLEGDTLVLGKTEDHTALSLAVPTRQDIAGEPDAGFHLHGSRAGLPLSAVLVYPDDAKALSIAKTEINASGRAIAVEPSRVAAELLAFLVRAQAFADAAGVVLGGVTLLLATLLATLVAKIRAAEYATLADIGFPRAFTVAWLTGEIGALLTAAVIGAAGLVVAADLVVVRLLASAI
ncbi:MAG: hypothetical protein AAF108_02685 [Planctomycetota bacterium]